MPGIQYSQLMAFLALFAGMVIIGCDRSLDVDMTNISGAWTANFNDLELIVVFGADGSYEMYADDRSASSVQQGGMGLLVMTGWSDYLGTYRWELADDEVVLRDDEGTTVTGRPMVVKEVTRNTLTLQLGEKAPIEFTRTTQPANPPSAPAVPSPVPGQTPAISDPDAGDEPGMDE